MIRRYLKVLRLFWSTALAAEMEYRINFLLAAVTSIGGMTGSIFALFLFYRVGHQLGGWTWSQALIVLGVFTILDGFASTYLSPNLNQIVEHVQEGTLDFVLLKPLDSQFWLSWRNFSPWGLTDVAVGTALILYAGSIENLSAVNYLAGLLPLAMAVTILYSLWFILAATSIWFVKIYNVTQVLRSLVDAGRFPIVAYPVAYRVFFTFVLPVAFLTTVPAQAMLGQAALATYLLAAAIAALLLAVARLFWKFALRYYTSASS